MRDPDGSVRVDACVNCGNTYASWAELEPPGRATELLQQAESAYKAALQKEEDAMVRSSKPKRKGWASAPLKSMYKDTEDFN